MRHPRTTPPTPRDVAMVHAAVTLSSRVDAAVLRRASSKFRRYYPDDGPLRRELYRFSTTFFTAGAVHRERILMAANQVGKTETGAYETTAHLTGQYPPWWDGKRFRAPIHAWCAGDTMETTRNILQVALMGPYEGVSERRWSGMIPPWLVYHTTRRLGAIPNCLDEVHVKHFTDGMEDGVSTLGFKSYDQGRKSFQGTGRELIWLDEEPPDAGDDQQSDIWSECLTRTINTDGIVIGTFTPLRGMTTFIEQYLDTAVMPDPARPGQLIGAAEGFRPSSATETEE